MGHLDLKPGAMVQEELATPVTDPVGWLHNLIVTLASSKVAGWHAEGVRLRLRELPFELLIAYIEQYRPDVTSVTEIALYEHWIDANQGGSALLCAAWYNLGTLFFQVGNQTNAAIAYGNALVLKPDMHSAAINLGLVQEAMGQPEQALETWKRAIQPASTRVALEIQQGRLLEGIGRLEEAEQILRGVLMTDPAQPDVIHHWIHLRQKTCQWPVTLPISDLSMADLVRSSGPLGILALTDDIALQAQSAAAWVERKTQPAPRRLAPSRPYAHDRIRIGYISSDFCSHAMSYLVTELFEHHDRSRFEVFGYCSSREDGTELRKRVLAAFDHCRMIRTLSDEQAAQVIRNDEIDVLIDLNGITDGTRLAVLRWRPAPIQATYLGLIGPLPMPELDYLLCDAVAIPPEHEAEYSPKPLPVGPIYQANDTKRTVGRKLSRQEAGLPEDRFVLCSFSRHYKITEEMFTAWMSILRQCDRAVLWLAKDNIYSEKNLLKAAESAGIATSRLIFSERADPDLYLSRLGVADLFLDTFPYNAGTLASDALRMRLPLVTLCGEAFASRMATTLLYAIGARDGITTSVAKYTDKVVRLINDPAEYERYRAFFTEQAWDQTIGNIDRFTRAFEDTFDRLVRAGRNV